MAGITKRTLSGAVLLLALALAGVMADGHPNIVYIMADDHNHQSISAYNPKSFIQTPGIDRLAREGMRFTRTLVPNSICAPSRAVVLTGKYSHINGFYKNKQAFDGSQPTFPKLLQKAGYETAIVGKWHLKSQPTGFDYYAVMAGQGRYIDCRMKMAGKPWQDGGRGGTLEQGYLTDVITDLAIDWLDKRTAKKPFMLMVHHKAPHCPHTPAARHKNLFKDTVFPVPETLHDTYGNRALASREFDKAYSLLRTCNDGGQYESMSRHLDADPRAKLENTYQLYMRAYLRLVASLDENVVRLLDYLDEAGLADNTLVVYTSDNGYFNGEHGLYNKMWMYEESIKVPFIVRWPGHTEPGSVNAQLTSLLDIAPTVLDLAGSPMPEDLQGHSLKALFEGRDEPVRDAFYYHYYSAYGVPEIVGVRTETHKLIHYPGLKDAPRWELFNLVADPQEMNNLSDNPECAEVFGNMKRLLQEQIGNTGDPVTVAGDGS